MKMSEAWSVSMKNRIRDSMKERTNIYSVHRSRLIPNTLYRTVRNWTRVDIGLDLFTGRYTQWVKDILTFFYYRYCARARYIVIFFTLQSSGEVSTRCNKSTEYNINLQFSYDWLFVKLRGNESLLCNEFLTMLRTRSLHGALPKRLKYVGTGKSNCERDVYLCFVIFSSLCN